MPDSSPTALHVYFRVHDFVQHSPDSQLAVGKGVEHDMVLDPLGPVALPQPVSLLAGFGVAHEFLNAVLNGGKVSIGLGFALLLERVDPNADEIRLGRVVFDEPTSHVRPLTPPACGLRV